jgi:hypothetical protein
MSYDRDLLKQDFCPTWTVDDFSIFKYKPKGRFPDHNEARQLVLDFKGDWTQAIELVTKIVVGIVGQNETTFRDDRCCRFVVAVPGHNAGGPGKAGTSVCTALAEKYDWLTFLPDGLQRLHAVTKSAWAHGDDRPDYSTHAESIGYAGPMLRPTPCGILLFDDVITKGNTSSACRDILKGATGVGRVTGLYLGRTV